MINTEPKFNFSQDDITQARQFSEAVDSLALSNPEVTPEEIARRAKKIIGDTASEDAYLKAGGGPLSGGEEEPIESDFEAGDIAHAARTVAESKIDAGLPQAVSDMLDEANADNEAFDASKHE